MFEALELPFVQRGLAEVALLAVAAGLVGTWIVLRGLAFHSHAVGTASFPGLVLAEGVGFAPVLGALGAAAVFAVLVALLARRRGDERGSEVAIVLVAMLGLGVILASDVFSTPAGVETLLFGSLLLIDARDLALAGGVALVALAATALAGRHWLARGFDAESERVETRGARLFEPALLLLVALTAAAAVTAVGALLVAALLVVPAATTRLWTKRMRSWQLATVALAAAEGTAGVLLSVELNAPPGATIAVLAGLVFAAAAAAAAARGTGRGGTLARWSAAGAAALTLAGCGGDGDEPRVVATTPVVGDLANQVSGPEIDVAVLLAQGTDPHDYEPRPADVKALASAEVVFAGGGDVDAWIGDALDDSGSNAKLVVLGERIPHPLGDDELDPHWWHDPRNVAALAPVIADAIAAVEPAARAAIERGGARLRARALELDAAIARCVMRIPAAKRKLVTDHDAFAYFAERYGFEVSGTVFPALSTQAQPSAGDLAELREAIEREGVPAIFPEASVSGDLAERIASETGARADSELYGDSLGAPGSDGATWAEAEAANASAIATALADQPCEVRAP